MHYDIELDICPAYGWQGGPMKDVLIKRLVSGREKRKPQSYYFLHTYILPLQNVAKVEYLLEVKNFYMVMDACVHSFNVKDWGDFQVEDGPLGVSPAGSTPIQLVKVYSAGPASYTRPITKPRLSWVNEDGSVGNTVIYENGVAKTGTLDTATGLFTPTSPWTPAAVITWDGQFLVPVRFDQMSLQSTIDNRVGLDFAVNGSVSLIEVIE